MSIRVTLTWSEYHLAVYCGALRILESAKMKAKDHKVERGDPVDNDVQAAAAEMAAGKALNQYWGAGVNTFRQPDIGRNIEVRRTPYPNGKLRVAPKDRDDRPFVLVRGTVPDFEVVGWIYGRDAKQECWKGNPHNDGDVYLVPQEALQAFDDAALSAHPCQPNSCNNK